MPLHLYTSTPLHLYTSTPLHFYASTPLPLYASTPLHLYASTPLPLYAFTPLHLYTSTLLRLHTSTPLRLYTSTPLHLYTSTPLQLYASTPLRLYTFTPLHLYTSTPVYLFTPTPLRLYTSSPLQLKRCTSRMYFKSSFIQPLYQQFAVFIRKHGDFWSIRSSKWNQSKFTPICRWFDYPVKIQHRVTKLSKRALFILRNMNVKNQSKENKNNDISKTPKEIRWHKLQNRYRTNWNCSRIHLFRHTSNSNRKLYSCTRTLKRKSSTRLL